MNTFDQPPAIGAAVEVAPGILWLRLPLPFRLNHVNIYLFDDGDGWTVFDTGMADAATRDAWEQALSQIASNHPIKRIIGSHFHLDHVGLAGWLCERFECPFYMSQTEYLLARVFQTADWQETLKYQSEFFINFGVDAAAAEKIARDRLQMRALVTRLPPTFHRLRGGDIIRLAGRDWTVMTGAGHAVEQVMLYSASDNIFISADQILPKISPNISVGFMLPDANPLGGFLQSLNEIKSKVPDDVVVLPGHITPFNDLHPRINALIDHHKSRCAAVKEACRGRALTAVELIPIVFGRPIGSDALGSAVGEVVSHTNYLKETGELEILRDEVIRYAVR